MKISRFAYGTITVGNSAVAVYILYDESREETFETSDGGTLLIDAYGQATFEDASGEKTRRNRKPRGGHGD